MRDDDERESALLVDIERKYNIPLSLRLQLNVVEWLYYTIQISIPNL